MRKFDAEKYEDGKIRRLIYLFGALFFVIFLYFALGCATKYEFVINPDGTITANSSSYREFAYFNMAYNPQTGYFEVVAIGVTDDTAEVVQAAIEVGGETVTVLTEKQAFDYMLRNGEPPGQ